MFLNSLWAKVKQLVSSIPDSWKYEFRSGIHTFVAAAIGVWLLMGGGIPTSKEAVFALLSAMLRAGVKALSVRLVPSVDRKVD